MPTGRCPVPFDRQYTPASSPRRTRSRDPRHASHGISSSPYHGCPFPTHPHPSRESKKLVECSVNTQQGKNRGRGGERKKETDQGKRSGDNTYLPTVKRVTTWDTHCSYWRTYLKRGKHQGSAGDSGWGCRGGGGGPEMRLGTGEKRV